MTYRELLNQLKDQVLAKRIIEIYHEQDRQMRLDRECEHPEDLNYQLGTIIASFSWSSTSECEDDTMYWDSMKSKAKKGEILFKGQKALKKYKKPDHIKAFAPVNYMKPRIGFEATYRSDDVNYDILHRVFNNSKMYGKFFSKQKSFKETHQDPYVVEVKSAPIEQENLSQLYKDFTSLNNVARRLGGFPSCRYSGESPHGEYDGGGHLHFDLSINFSGFNLDNQMIKDRMYLFFINATNFFCNNPWMNWALNSPIDDDGARSPLYHNEYLKRLDIKGEFQGFNDKNMCIRFKFDCNTLEYRMFRMPKDAAELEFNIEIANKMNEYFWNMASFGQIIPRKIKKIEDLQKIPIRRAFKGVMEVCKLLDIDEGKMISFGKFDNMKRRYDLEAEYIKQGKLSGVKTLLT